MSAQKRVVVGTTPIIIANPNPQRQSIRITMLPTSIESGNTGRVHIGKGFPPSATLGDGNQGDPINAGGEVSDEKKYDGDTSIFLGAWWAVASASGQIIIIDEI